MPLYLEKFSDRRLGWWVIPTIVFPSSEKDGVFYFEVEHQKIEFTPKFGEFDPRLLSEVHMMHRGNKGGICCELLVIQREFYQRKPRSIYEHISALRKALSSDKKLDQDNHWHWERSAEGEASIVFSNDAFNRIINEKAVDRYFVNHFDKAPMNFPTVRIG